MVIGIFANILVYLKWKKEKKEKKKKDYHAFTYYK